MGLSLPSGAKSVNIGPFDEGESRSDFQVSKSVVSSGFFSPDSYLLETLITDPAGAVIHRFVLRYRKVNVRRQQLPIDVDLSPAKLPPPDIRHSKLFFALAATGFVGDSTPSPLPSPPHSSPPPSAYGSVFGDVTKDSPAKKEEVEIVDGPAPDNQMNDLD
jgi:hypothetical protein